MIRFTCFSCGTLLTVPDRAAGSRGKCTACGKVNIVPPPDPPETGYAEQAERLEPEYQEPKSLWQRLSARAKIGVIAGGGLFIVMLCCAGVALVTIGGGGPKFLGELFNNKALEVTTREILEAYHANALAADEKYKGKTVQIEGVLRSSPNRREDNRMAIEVSGNGSSFICYFDENHKGELAKLSEGKIVAVRGSFVRPCEIEKCEFVEPKPRKLELSASEFIQQLAKDGDELSNARYRGKTVQITGKVAGHGDFLPSGTFFPTGGSQGFPKEKTNAVSFGEAEHGPLICRFNEQMTWQQILNKAPKGQIITVRGIYHKRHMHECELVK